MSKIFIKPGRARPAGRRGLTLMEMIMVVVIILILAAVALPRFGLIINVRQEASAKQLISTIQFAREQALSSQKRYSVYFDIDENSYKVEERSEAPPPYFTAVPDPANPAVDLAVDLSASYPDVVLASASFAGLPRLEFDAVGAPYGTSETGTATSLTSDGLITISSGGATIRIYVAPTNGRVYIR